MAKKTIGKKTTQIEAETAVKIVQATQGITLESVLGDLSKTHVKVTSALGDVSALLTDRVNQVELLDNRIQLQKQELSDLNEIAVTAGTLADLQEEIDRTRAEWADEDTRREVEIAEKDAELKKQRIREAADYNYNLTQTRKAEEDKWRQGLQDQQRTESIRRADLERSWAEREAVLKAAEDELKQLRDLGKTNEARVAGEITRRVEAIKADLTSKQETHLKMIEMEAQKNAAINANATAALTEANTQLQAQVTALQAEVREANARALQVTNQALQAASGQQALRTLQEDRARTDSQSTGNQKR